MQLSDSISLHQRGSVDVLEVSNSCGSADISLFGAHVLSFVPNTDNRERLWLSESAVFDGVTPIRGGIPVCWPWFSDRFPSEERNLPSHGFVRNQIWKLDYHEELSEATRLVLTPSSTSGPGFKFNVSLKLVITVGHNLKVELITENIGPHSVRLTGALHSYFAISHISQVELFGLSGSYHDKTRDWQEFQTPSPYLFTEETDRVHHDKPETLDIADGSQRIQISSGGHDSIVVWNPWQENSIAMKDMPDGGYENMLCVESAVTDGIDLAPGKRHCLAQTIY